MTSKQFASYFPHFAIQTFDDSQLKRPSLVKLGTPKDFTFQELRELNEAGAGIYFTPNQFPRGERKKSVCTGINAWYVDLDSDSGTPEQQLKCLLEAPQCPTFIVKTKNGHHAYWLAKDATLVNFEAIARGLIFYFKADEACKDNSRVLRVPGFKHMKDPQNAFLISLIHEQPTLRYTEEEMLKSFPLPKTPAKTKKLLERYDGFWENITSLNQRDMLSRLSGTDIVNGEIISFQPRSTGGQYIQVNGKASDAWLDEHGMIGSGKGASPTWVQWLTYYGRTKPEIYRWVKEKMPDIMPEPLEDMELEEIKSARELEEFRSIMNMKKLKNTWGNEEFDSLLPNIQRYSFITLFGASGSGKTTFTTWLARRNSEIFGKKVLYFQLDMSVSQMKANYARRRHGVGKEATRLGNYQTQELEEYLSEIETTLEIHDSKDKKLSSIIKIIREKKDCPLVVIDCLDKIEIEEFVRTENDSQKIITSRLSELAHELKVPIILIHHTNKEIFKKKDTKARGLEGLRGSGKIVDNSDVVAEVHQHHTFLNQTVITVYKDRDNMIQHHLEMNFQDGEFIPIY